MNTDRNKLIIELKDALNSQIDSVRKGDYKKLEAITENCSKIISKLSNQPNDNDNSDYIQIKDLYKKLTLILAASKKQITESIRKTADSKKTLRAYQIT